MQKILVVEDEKGIQLFIQECLEEAGYEIVTADDGVAAIAKFRQENFDIVLLDIMLPKMDGYAVCEIMRLESEVPVIMLTAMNEDEDQIHGFNVLADDYICKPFAYGVLIKRIEAALRKSSKENKKSVLQVGNILLNLVTYEVYVDRQAILLTSIEFNLLKYLMEHKEQVLSREQLLQAVWGMDYYDSSEKLVNHHIMNIRKKLNSSCIETIRGVGYRIAEKN